MSTIVLKYDSNNAIAKSVIEMIKTIGVFKIEKISGLDEAIDEMKTGKTIKCADFDDYLKKVK